MATTWEALHGDNWESSWIAVAVDGAAPDMTVWTVHAQARKSPADDTPMFDWTVPGGGIVVSTSEVSLSDGTSLVLPAVQLRLFPDDWDDVPRASWSGYVDVEMYRGTDEDAVERRTIIRKRGFKITPDYTR